MEATEEKTPSRVWRFASLREQGPLDVRASIRRHVELVLKNVDSIIAELQHQPWRPPAFGRRLPHGLLDSIRDEIAGCLKQLKEL